MKITGLYINKDIYIFSYLNLIYYFAEATAASCALRHITCREQQIVTDTLL